MANTYLIKLWITTLIVAPIVYMLFLFIYWGLRDTLDVIVLIPIMFELSILFSLPTLFTVFLVNKCLCNVKLKLWHSKVVTIVLACLGLIITMENTFVNYLTYLTHIYVFSILLSAYIIEYIGKLKHTHLHWKNFR